MSVVSNSNSFTKEIEQNPINTCNDYPQLSSEQQDLVINLFQEKKHLLPRLKELKEDTSIYVGGKGNLKVNLCWASVQIPLFSGLIKNVILLEKTSQDTTYDFSAVPHLEKILAILDNTNKDSLHSLDLKDLMATWNEIGYLQLEDQLASLFQDLLKEHITVKDIDKVEEFANFHSPRFDDIVNLCAQKRADDLIAYYQQKKTNKIFSYLKSKKTPLQLKKFIQQAPKTASLEIDEKNGKPLTYKQINSIIQPLSDKLEHLTLVKCDKFRDFDNFNHLSGLQSLTFRDRVKVLQVNELSLGNHQKLRELNISGSSIHIFSDFVSETSTLKYKDVEINLVKAPVIEP